MARSVQVLRRTARLLSSFDHDHPERGVTELAHHLDLPKATVHRILYTLELDGLVQQSAENGKYHLGFKLVKLGLLALERIDLRREALPFMERLVDDYQETVDLAVFDDGQMFYLEVLESPQPVKISASAGRHLPAHCTASGKAYLAHASGEDLETVLGIGLEPCTPRTICDPEALMEDLRVTRERGYGVSREEFETGISAVAAPVMDGSERPVGVIAIAGPTYRLSPGRISELGAAARDAARELSSHLGAGLV
jgi:DNA-binding IclR family transcriptional regulator